MKERERRLAGAGRQRNNKAPKRRPSKRAPERRPSRIRRIRRDHLVVIFDFSEATYVDNSAAMVIKQLMDVAREERTG